MTWASGWGGSRSFGETGAEVCERLPHRLGTIQEGTARRADTVAVRPRTDAPSALARPAARRRGRDVTCRIGVLTEAGSRCVTPVWSAHLPARTVSAAHRRRGDEARVVGVHARARAQRALHARLRPADLATRARTPAGGGVGDEAGSVRGKTGAIVRAAALAAHLTRAARATAGGSLGDVARLR